MEETEEKIEFTIKNKPITFKFSVAFTVISVALALMMILLIVACRIYEKVNFIWFIEVIPAFSLGGSIFGLYTYYKEEFSFKDGEFRYVKVFKKDVIIKSDTLSCVYLRPLGYKTEIEFMNKRGERAAIIFDDGTLLQDGLLIAALNDLKIEVRGNVNGDK